MTEQTISLAERLAKAKAEKEAAQKPQVEQAAPTHHIFYADLPQAISYMTPTAKPVFFYEGYHMTSDPEIAAFCATIPGVIDVTDRVAPEEVPKPASRTRQRSWASAERTSITPGELLARAVRVASTADLGGNSAASNSSV